MNQKSRGFIFVIDANVDQNEMKRVKDAIIETTRKIQEDAKQRNELSRSHIFLLSFSNVVSIYELQANGLAMSHAFDGSKSIMDNEKVIKRLNYLMPRLSASILEENCIRNLSLTLDSLVSLAPPPATRSRKQVKQEKKNHRSTGVAAELAVLLLKSQTPNPELDEVTLNTPVEGGTICLLTNGSPNLGPGAVSQTSFGSSVGVDNNSVEVDKVATQFYKSISVQCGLDDINFFVFCSGLNTFNIPVLQNLVINNGGTVILHQDFGSEFSKDLNNSVRRSIGKQGLFSVQTSQQINLKHIIGPAVPIQESKEAMMRLNELDQKTRESVANDEAQYCKMAGVNNDCTFTIYYDVVKDVPDNGSVYIQFVTGYLSYKGNSYQPIFRVITTSITSTTSLQSFRESINPHVVAILISKLNVLNARKRVQPIQSIFDSLDKDLYKILYHNSDKSSTSTTSTTTTTDRKGLHIPQKISAIPRKLFLLRRGPLLGPILQHPDDIDYIRCIFLYSTYQDAIRLIDPPLLVTQISQEGTISFLEFPLEDLALQSTNILILDHHTDIFVWSGSLVSGPEYDIVRQRCLQYIDQVTMYRFPSPQVRVFKEGDSNSRWLQCRLIPSHKDSPQEQAQSFPQILELDESSRQQLLSKFHRTDDLSFNQYLRKLWQNK
eukprot:TRINITY_DN2419_c0_g2_i3.p1 TRINITY_DN2419_c0_g2~~TRINITY_DN2419_c0_g2_i3.p1  ORF type:complete len:663 (-),score=157.65 TRINITY_DN2419_c0_g2_i3:134-2122(-)